jgi:uncharacterized protein (TIGR02246 family)
MTMFRIWGVLLAMALACPASAQQAPPEVAKVREAYIAGTHAGDAKAVAALYTEDGTELPPNEMMMKGRTAVEKYYTGFFTANAVKLSLSAIETTATGDIAYDVGTYSQTITPKQAGGKPMTDRGKYVVILRRAAGQWRVKYAIYNSDLPAQPKPGLAK